MSEKKRSFSERFISGLPDNNYCMHCDVLDVNANYKMCQHIICALVDKKIQNNTYDNCVNAIRSKKCVALQMVVEEKRSNKVLYYKKLEIKNIPERPLVIPKVTKNVFGLSGDRKTAVAEKNKASAISNGISDMLGSIITEELK